MAHPKIGSLPWANLVQPSIDLANNGFPLSLEVLIIGPPILMLILLFIFKRLFLERKMERLHKLGELWTASFARTLIRIREWGQDGFYKVVLVAEDRSLALWNKMEVSFYGRPRAFTAVERKTIKEPFNGYDIYSCRHPVRRCKPL